jgi:hypothetical protein
MILAFHQPRLTGTWDFKDGEPYVVFDKSEFVVERLTENAEALAKVIGEENLHCNHWTNFSN